MSKVTGQLQEITTKNFNNGGSAVYIKVNNTEYKFGKFAPRGFAEGDWVEFDAQSKPNGQYMNWSADYKTLRKAQPGSNPNPEPMDAGPSQRPARTGGFNATANDERQEIISKQAALNTGFNLFSKLVELGAITPPASVKKNGLYEFYEAAFHNEAAKCFKLSTGKDWDIAKAAAPTEKDDFSDEVADIDNGGDAW